MRLLVSSALVLVSGCALQLDIDDTRLVDVTPEDIVLSHDDGAATVVPGQYIVVLRDGVGVVDFDQMRFGAHLTRVRDLAPQNATVLAGVDDSTLRDIAADRDVVAVIPDAVAHIMKGKPQPPPAGQVLPAGIDRVGADEIANKGAGVTVCVVDTGIDYTHPDLTARYAGGHDFVNNDNDPKDDNDHGTHVSGTIAASDDGQGVVGMAPQASIVAEKVLNRRGSGSYSAITAGINACVAAGADVINMSLGGPSSDPTQQAALQAARDAGVTTVVAAGNDGNDLDVTPSYPASYDGIVITVAAAWIDETARNLGDAVSYPTFSNYGSAVDLSAPGVYVVSDKRGGGTTSMSGTSMASPHVAGAAALYIAAHPGASPAQVEAALVSNLENVNNVSVHPEEFLDVRSF